MHRGLATTAYIQEFFTHVLNAISSHGRRQLLRFGGGGGGGGGG